MGARTYNGSGKEKGMGVTYNGRGKEKGVGWGREITTVGGRRRGWGGGVNL